MKLINMMLIHWHTLSSKCKRKINFVIDYYRGGQNIVGGVNISLRYFDPGVKISWGSKYRLTPVRPSNLKLDSNRQFFRLCDREIWWMTSKNNRALLLYYVKLCASFQIHWWIQTGFTVQKRSLRVEIGDTLSRVTLKFDEWPWKTIAQLFYATSSFVQHFVAIGEFKVELQSGNVQSGSNLMIFRAVPPWNLTDDLAK